MPEMDLRQISDMVAVHVMEWEPWVSPVAQNGEPDCWLTGDEDSPTIRMRDWNPAEDIGDAWRVVEKMREREVYTDIYRRSETVQVEMWMYDASFWQAEAETASLAICLAALRAVGAEVPEDA